MFGPSPFFPSYYLFEGQFDLPYDVAGNLEGALIKVISQSPYGETIFWDAPVDSSVIKKQKNGNVSVHLDSCEMITGGVDNCTVIDLSWEPDGFIDVTHKASNSEPAFFFPPGTYLERGTKHSMKSAVVTATINGVTGTGNGGIYSYKLTSQLVTEEDDD